MRTETEYRIHLQSARTIYVKVDILNNNEKVVYPLETEVIDGNISIDAKIKLEDFVIWF